jgi:hypothetical protein
MLRAGRGVPGVNLVRASILLPLVAQTFALTGGLYGGCVRALASVEAGLGACGSSELRRFPNRGSIGAVRGGFQGRWRHADRLKACLTMKLRELASVAWLSGYHGAAIRSQGAGINLQ